MNICQVLISNGWGGAETVVYELARHLRDKGENVSIILNDEIVKYYAGLEDVKLFNIGSVYPPKSIIPRKERTSWKQSLPYRALLLLHLYLDELLRYRHYGKIRKQLTQFLSDNHIDVIHAHLLGSIFLILFLDNAKIPRVATLHGEYALRGIEPVHPTMRPLLRWQARKFREALRKMDKVTHVSAFFMLDALKNWGFPLKDKSVVIHNGIDLSGIQSSVKSTLKLKGAFNLLFPGGAKSRKGGEPLIAILPKIKEEIPDIHVYIAPSVPQNHPLRKMVSKLGLEQNVTFTGFLPKHEYRSLLNSVDILVMPSREEAFGIVYVEAMALGKPIIAGKNGGIPEVVTDGRNGILVEPEPDQIAKAVLSLYKNESLRKEMSQNNLQDVVKFDWDLIVDQYVDLYRKTLNER